MSGELIPNTRDQQFLAAILDELRELNKNLKGLAKAGPSPSPKKKSAPRKGKGGKTNGTAS